MTMKSLLSTVSLALLLGGAAAAAQAQIAIGHLADYSGATSDVGTPFGQARRRHLSPGSTRTAASAASKVNVDTIDYGYQVPRAIAQYKKWSGGDKVAAIHGLGHRRHRGADRLRGAGQDPVYSRPPMPRRSPIRTGASGKAKPAPYNFFYGPSYSDAVRGMLTWAAEDWKAKGKPGKPKFVHMGANHPYPNAPKAAGEAIAAELGFEVLPPIVFALTPGDYSAQCLSLKSSGANYAYLGNTAGSNISVLKACKTAGVDVQFLGNVWGMDENAAKAAGDAADGVVFPLRTAVAWGGNAPGMKTVMEISKMSDPTGTAYRPVHYIAGVCTALYMKEARRLGRQERRRHRRERHEGLLPEEGLGAGRHGRRLQSLDLDREGSPRHAQGRSLSHEGRRRDRRRRSTISIKNGAHQAREGQDRSTCRASRNGSAGEVRSPRRQRSAVIPAKAGSSTPRLLG